MNRVLYQLSYAAISSAMLKISFVIIYRVCRFVKIYFCIFPEYFGDAICEVIELRKPILLFCLGGSSYVLLEHLWRGWSHFSMFLAGGSCFLLLGKLNRVRPRLTLPLRGLVGAGIITMVELLAGLIFNRDYQVWDYRRQPLNFHGQICARFFLLWIPLSLAAMNLYSWLEMRLSEHRRSES